MFVSVVPSFRFLWYSLCILCICYHIKYIIVDSSLHFVGLDKVYCATFSNQMKVLSWLRITVFLQACALKFVNLKWKLHFQSKVMMPMHSTLFWWGLGGGWTFNWKDAPFGLQDVSYNARGGCFDCCAISQLRVNVFFCIKIPPPK